MMTAPRCRHIKTNGLTCKSPAIHGESRCFYHRRQMHRHTRFRAFADAPGLTKHGEHMPLIPVDDHDSIQLALSMVINGLAIGHLEPLRAKALLYGLQIASSNARNTQPEPSSRHDLALVTQTDPVGDDLAQPGSTVDITHPVVAYEEEEARIRALRKKHNLDDEEEEDDEENEEDDEEIEEEDDEEEDDEEEDDEEVDEEDDEDVDAADDLKVFNEVNEFMRRHP